MEIQQAKQQFIEAWGTLGNNWGINRAMAQIHALLLVSDIPLSTEDLMEALDMSRGSANTNIRTLMDWRLVEKRLKMGERREFFEAEKDIWKVFTRIVYERRKKELEPLRLLLQHLKQIKTSSKKTKEETAFLEMIHQLDDFTHVADKLLLRTIHEEESWYLQTLTKVLKITQK